MMRNECKILGPIHEAFHEPIELVLKVQDNVVTDVDVKLGHVYRAIELIVTRKSWIQAIQLVERICGLCGSVQRRTFIAAIESLAGIDVPSRAKFIRTIILELERIQSHLMLFTTIFHVLKLNKETLNVIMLRERVLELMRYITGSRRHVDFLVVGGVSRDLSESCIAKIVRGIEELELKVRKELIPLIESNEVFLSKTKGIGKIDSNVAQKLHLVGPVARASGLLADVRVEEPYEAYGDIDVRPIVCSGGDNWTRMYVRAMEILESIYIIRRCLELMPQGEIINPKAKIWLRVPPKIPKGEIVARSEAPRGEVIHYVKSEGDVKPERLRVRTPTYANLVALKYVLRGLELENVPITYLTIDPCISCVSRYIKLNKQ